MKFDVCIMNPPYRKKVYIGFIKKNKIISDKICTIIPSKDGNIISKIFNCINSYKLRIFTIKSNEFILHEIFTYKKLSDYSISLPKASNMLNNYYNNGEYLYKYIDDRGKNKLKKVSYCTFNFLNYEDLDEFKKRLFKRDWLKVKGILTPNYQDILEGLNYIKSYRKI